MSKARFGDRMLPTLLTGATLWLGGAGAVIAAPNARVVLPPLVASPSGEHHPGKVLWADLVTPDVATAERFYGDLFGWTFQSVPGDPHYVLALLGGEPVGGLYQKTMPAGQPMQSAWLTFISSNDVDSAKQSVLQHGGKVRSEPHDYPRRGRQAVFSDPEGATFAVLATHDDDTPDYLAPPGDWIWSSLIAADPRQEADFYKTLFGYDVYQLPGEGAVQPLILSSDDYARAGVSLLPADSQRRRAHWLNFIRVSDAAATASKAASLGGKVLVEPRLDRHGGHLAVLADPGGAPVGIMEWSEDETKQEPK